MGPTAVEENLVTASWLGKMFYLRGEVWIDAEFEAVMRVVEYDPDAGQPGALDDFARLEQDMIVVLKGTAYELRRGTLPARPVLLQSVPNPFNPETMIRYQLPQAGPVRLEIRNLLGQEVSTLVDEVQAAGFYGVTWDGRDAAGGELATGVYLCRLQAGGWVETRKLLLLR